MEAYVDDDSVHEMWENITHLSNIGCEVYHIKLSTNDPFLVFQQFPQMLLSRLHLVSIR